MYILYLDESGINPSDRYFVLAGVGIFERQTYWLARALDRVQAEFLPALSHPVNFHASDIRSGRTDPWDRLPASERRQLLEKAYDAIVESKAVLFGVAVERAWFRDQAPDEYHFAFEDILGRFESFLRRRNREQDTHEQRGLVVVAESSYRDRIETLGLRLRREGSRWGELYNLAEVPMFAPAASSRLLQAADLCANAIWGRYEKGYTGIFDRLVGKFDAADGIIHGLCHYSMRHAECACPACMSRRLGR